MRSKSCSAAGRVRRLWWWISSSGISVECTPSRSTRLADGLQAADGCLADLAPLERTEPVAEGDHRCHLPRRRRGHYDVRAARRLTAPSPKFPHSSHATWRGAGEALRQNHGLRYIDQM